MKLVNMKVLLRIFVFMVPIHVLNSMQDINSDINRLNWSLTRTIKISTKVTQIMILKPRNTSNILLIRHLIGHFHQTLKQDIF